MMMIEMILDFSVVLVVDLECLEENGMMKFQMQRIRLTMASAVGVE